MSKRPKDDYYERYVDRMMTRFNEDYHRRVRGHVPSDPESEEETGPYCVRRKNTLVYFVVTDKRRIELCSHIWDYKVIERKDKTLSLMVLLQREMITVHISVSAPVGRWILMVETYHVQLEGTRNVTEKTDLYILFNPWHKDESVGAGMPPEGLEEYLLKDTGKVWRGTADSPVGRPWVFGQFHHVVLPAITLLLAKFDMPCDIRGDPIELVRALSSIVST
uniref:Uncharacterized protein n=1 Tax=Timema monikensis TaxID=170555 RepID=A0A7R9DYX4_9NEOP|nr:unnamed protein product [Timema monikensis]